MPGDTVQVLVKDGETTEIEFALEQTIVSVTDEILITGQRKTVGVTSNDVRSGSGYHARGGRSSSPSLVLHNDAQRYYPYNTEDYDFISENLEVYMRALHTTKNVDIMARPSILVKNNAEAEISLGRSVPIMSNVQTNITGLVTGKIKYENILTQLMVTPQIHPDNYVSLVITQTIDDVSAETFQISEEFNPQVILRRKANTTLRVKDGQTVCLGGFITDDTTSDEKKVPLLGDIPILGYLFKYSVQSRTKRELVIFITPHIMETPSELLRMTNEQRIFSDAEVREERRNKDILEPQVDLRPPPFREPLPQGP